MDGPNDFSSERLNLDKAGTKLLGPSVYKGCIENPANFMQFLLESQYSIGKHYFPIDKEHFHCWPLHCLTSHLIDSRVES